ncbi:MAG TPA: hypothetical protein VGG95_13370 [Edaphobacter sp.]
MRYLAILFLLIVVLMAGAFMLWNKLFGTSVSGSVSATGPAVGNWELTPDVCRSGDRRNFFGIQMFSKQNKELSFLYVEEPARGNMISVNVPGTDHGYRFFQEDCAVLNGSLHRGPTINQVRSISGTVDVDCHTDDASVKAHLTFKNCD